VDASHRLYMAEMARLMADEEKIKTFSALQSTTKAALEKAFLSVKNVEGMEESTDEMDVE